MLKKTYKIALKILLSVLVLILVLWILLQTPFFQNFITDQITKKLGKELNTTISVGHVNFELFDRMRLDNTLILDQNGDTLLYADAVRINITNWFFLKRAIELKYIGLDNAEVVLERNSSAWNYQFLLDYFSSPPKDKKNRAASLNLKILNLRDVSLHIKDQWSGNDRFFSVKELRMEAERFDPENKSLNINLLRIDQPVFDQSEYAGLDISKADNNSLEQLTDTTSDHLLFDNWEIYTKKIQISDGEVTIRNQRSGKDSTGVFNSNHIGLRNITADIRNINLKNDTLKSDVILALSERSGFTIKQLKSGLKMTSGSVELSSLYFETEKSHLGNYLALNYHSLESDLKDFVHRMWMESTLSNSVIDSDDLAYFIPKIRTWKTKFSLSGTVNGSVDNLTLRNMAISDGGNNILKGNASLRGLPDITESFMDLEIKELRTTIARLSKIIPAFRTITQPNLMSFGNIRYSGNFTGFINDFVTFGHLSTSIGDLDTDLHLNVSKKSVPVYSGKVSTTNFNLGQFINDTKIGLVSFRGEIDGQGFTAETLDLNVNGAINQIGFNGRDYQNILARAQLKKDVFRGSASIHDPNIIIDTLTGTINFSDENPFSNFEAEIGSLNLQKIGITKNNIVLTGHFDLDFQGKNIDNFLGFARVNNATLTNDGHQLSFDSLAVSSYEYEGRKILSLRTNELEGHIDGNFKIMELPVAFQLFLNRYYPAYIQRPAKEVENQDFSFLIHARNVSEYISLFNKNLKGFDESVIEGQVNIARNNLRLDVKIPEFQYLSAAFRGIHLNGLGNRDTLGFYADAEDIVTNDSLHTPGTKIEVFSSDDVSDIHITTAPDNNRYTANISAGLNTKKDGFSLIFNPSEFVLNQKRWNIQKGGRIDLNKKIITADNVLLTQDDQEIKITGRSSGEGNNDIDISLKNIMVEDFLPYFLKFPRLAGLLSGNVNITNPLTQPSIRYETSLSEFFVERDSIGLLKIAGNYDSGSQVLFSSLTSDNNPYKFTANLLYQKHDSLSPISGTVNFDRSEIRVLGNFMAGIASDINGFATGILNISGALEDPKITGSVSLDSTSLVVDYTKCKYQLASNSIINFRDGAIDFGTLSMLDIHNRQAAVTGKIRHNFFRNFFFDKVHIVTGKNFQLLNSTAKDNDQFYGNVTGFADLTINGLSTDMHMALKGEPTDTSHIFLPIDEPSGTGSLDYLDFIQYGEEMAVDKKVRQSTNISLDMELTANPLATIDVILDETTGDIIKARGSGKLFISVGTREPLSIRGRYTVSQGEYTFNFQTFLKTPFTLQQGFIEWQGDPYEAILNIDALYRAKNVNLSNIPTSTGFTNTSGDIDILFKLRGTLKDPSPEFEFQFPFENPLKSDPIASEFLKTRFQSDNNEMLNQVASLLLFNTFLTTEQGPRAGFATGNFVGKTVGQILSATLTSSLNNWLQKLLKTKSVNLYANINPADLTFQRGEIDEYQIRNVGSFSFKYTFPNNKFILNVGGNVNYNANPGLTNNNSDLLLTPDISFEMLISPSGNFRVIGFNRSDFDPGNIANIASRNRTGIQLSYRVDFESFRDFFSGRKRE